MMNYLANRKVHISIFTILFMLMFSCNSNEKYNNIDNNAESELLNEYLYTFIERSEDQIDGANSVRKIYLINELTKLYDYDLIKRFNKYPDPLFFEALQNLLEMKNRSVPIFFSQLDKLSQYNIFPGVKDDLYKYCWSLRLSYPGFSKDSSHIVFTSSYYCGPLCGLVFLNFMKKVNGRWVFVQSNFIAMS